VFGVIVGVISALAALLYILEYFGVKPKSPSWGPSMPLSRNWKLAIMLILVAISLAMSGYAAYRGYRPKIVEKPVIVEKPITVSVPVPCPEPLKKSKAVQKVEIHPGATVTATTNAPDSAAVGINTGTVNVNPPLNPYAPIYTYDFNGGRRTSEPGKNSVVLGDEGMVFRDMVQLEAAKNWEQLRDVSENQITKTPGWLTPYLYAGEAYINLGDREKAVERLTYVKQKAGGNPAYADADRLLRLVQPRN